MNHTPGPWEVDWPLMQIMGPPTRKDRIYNPVTRAMTTFISPCSDEAKANARLIAAAPELLEALQIAMEYLSHIDLEWSKKAKAAIAKATGKDD